MRGRETKIPTAAVFPRHDEELKQAASLWLQAEESLLDVMRVTSV